MQRHTYCGCADALQPVCIYNVSCFRRASKRWRIDWTARVQLRFMCSRFMSSVLLLRNSWCCFKQTCSNPESVHAVDRSFHTLVVRNESELWGRRVLRSCNRAQHGKACVPHAFATNGKLVYFVVQHWVWISVTEWIKTQLPQKFTPTLTLSLNLIQDLLFLIVIWERQLKQIKAVTSLWTNHTDFVQWKKTLFGFA